MLSRLRTFPATIPALLVAAGAGVAQAEHDPWSFFASIIRLDKNDQENLRRAEVVARIVRTDGQEVAVFTAGTLDITADAYIDLVPNIETLWRGQYVPQLGRFSDPPRLEDLAGLTLGDSDLDDLRRCRVGDCGIKLSADEIRRVRAVIDRRGQDWRQAVEREFRAILLDRVRAYRARGLAGLPTYDGSAGPVRPDQVFLQMLDRSTMLREHAPELAAYVRDYPRVSRQQAPALSFLYWAKQEFGYKPVIAAFHVSMLRRQGTDGPEVITVSKQLFATHYIDGALAISALDPGGSLQEAAHLGYFHRSAIDLPMMWLLRGLVEGRIEDKAEEIFALQLERLTRAAARPALSRRVGS